MKLPFVVVTKPNQWTMTDDNTGEVRRGISAYVILPGEATVQKVSNLPKDVQVNCAYLGNWGLKNKTIDGKSQSVLDLIEADTTTEKRIDWDKVLGAK